MISNEDNLNDFLQNARGDRHLRLSISRNTVFAIIFSLIMHGLFLLLITPLIDSKPEAVLPARELTVGLAPPTPEKKINTEIKPESAPVTPAELTPKVIKPAIKKVPKQQKNSQEPTIRIPKLKSPKFQSPEVKLPDVITSQMPEKTKPLPEKTKPFPEKLPPNLTIPNESIFRESDSKNNLPKELPPAQAPVDMMAYVNQKRAARDAVESNAAKINAEATAKELGPSAEQLRDEKIKRNFENGTNGIFEITSLGPRDARFAFRGWTNDFGNSRKEFFEVEAKSGQDVRLIMIKKMISLIRQHYKGDFNWESHRLHRTIIMSARIEDSEGLEDFMMAEFFGRNYKTSQLN